MTTVDLHGLIGMWYFQPEEDVDFLALLSEPKDGEGFKLEYCFRYYSPESKNPFDGKDEKSWYGVRVDWETREEAFKHIREWLDVVYKIKHVGSLTEITHEGDDLKFFNEMKAAPFVHLQEVKKE